MFAGVTRVKIQKIGLKCSDWAQLFFEDVRVPAGNILGKEGDGFKQLMVQVSGKLQNNQSNNMSIQTCSFKTRDSPSHFSALNLWMN